MDIELAARQAFDSLALSEKGLVQELVRFEFYDAKKLNGYYRAPVLYMDKVLQSLADYATTSKTAPRRINLYCDTLFISETVKLPNSETFFCNITARQIKFLDDKVANPAIRMSLSGNGRLGIYVPSLPEAFNVQFQGEGMPQDSKFVSTPKNAFGVEYTCKDKALQERVLAGPPDSDFQYENWADLLNKDGTLEGVPFLSDNFPRLLNLQYLMAATQMSSNPQFSMALLNYICFATRARVGSSLNVQARTLRTSLAARLSETAVVSVPSLNIYSCKQILKSRLLAAQSFEATLLGYLSSERGSVNWSYLGSDLLRKSDDALEEYTFLEKLANKKYDNAVESHKYAEEKFKETNALVKTASKKFEASVEKWTEEQKDAAAKDILLAVVGVGVSIAVTLLTGGAAAPVAAATVANVATTASRVAKVLAKIKEIYEKIEKIYKEIEPIIEALKTVFQSITAMIEATRNAEAALEAPKNMKEGDMKLDALNATAQWNIFEHQVKNLEAQFKDLGIPNQADYLFALSQLAIYGKNYIQSQVNLVETGDHLATVTLRLRQHEKGRPSLEAMTKHFSTDDKVIAVLKTAMFDRLMSIRALVFVDFNLYVNAYMYHSLATHTPVLLSPVKPVGEYFADAARLQGAVSQFGSTELIQRKSFIFDHTQLDLDPTQVASQIKSDGRFTFTLSPSHTAFSGLFRIRLSRVRVHLRGVKTLSHRPLRLAIQTSGRFLDISEPDDETVSDTRAFTGDSRIVVFEKDISGGEERITCDGDYGLSKDYTMQTPFTEWTVEIARGGVRVDEVDVEGLNGVEVEFLCDFSYVDYM